MQLIQAQVPSKRNDLQLLLLGLTAMIGRQAVSLWARNLNFSLVPFTSKGHRCRDNTSRTSESQNKFQQNDESGSWPTLCRTPSAS